MVYPEYDNRILLGVVDTVFWDKTLKQYNTQVTLTTNLITTYAIKIEPETNVQGMTTMTIKDKRLIDYFFRFK
ncbi:hypothetical protein [Psychroserpens sp.]|uniref:hypothetical protein n=1 Tax=Psychroserpens sp. TaxID=2020870 RepID=UPI0039E22268